VPDGAIDLATAFRFFPNAGRGPTPRSHGRPAAAVRPGGHLLLNNHRSFWSPSYLARRPRLALATPGARNLDVVGLFIARGFEVVARRSLGLLATSEVRAHGLPRRLAFWCERVNLRLLSRSRTAGSNTVWLLRKNVRAGGVQARDAGSPD
jgi:hypothetical protein